MTVEETEEVETGIGNQEGTSVHKITKGKPWKKSRVFFCEKLN